MTVVPEVEADVELPDLLDNLLIAADARERTLGVASGYLVEGVTFPIDLAGTATLVLDGAGRQVAKFQPVVVQQNDTLVIHLDPDVGWVPECR